MMPRVKWGLIIGAVGLVINICADTICGLFGPLLGLIGGVVAGWLTGREESVSTKGQGAQYGLVAGSIAGVGAMAGRMLSGGLSLLIYGITELQPLVAPPPSDTEGFVGWWIGACCVGFLGLVFSGGAGALLGYVSSQPGRVPEAQLPIV